MSRYATVHRILQIVPAGMLPGMAAGVAAGTSLLKPDWAPVQLPALALLAWTLALAAALASAAAVRRRRLPAAETRTIR